MTSCVRLGRFGITLLVVGTIAAAGCSASVSISATRHPAQLATLTVGTSTDADVLRALGEPRGRGVARLVGVDGPRTIWFYDAYSGDGKRIDTNFLIVFLEASRYDGYLWLSWSSSLKKAP